MGCECRRATPNAVTTLRVRGLPSREGRERKGKEGKEGREGKGKEGKGKGRGRKEKEGKEGERVFTEGAAGEMKNRRADGRITKTKGYQIQAAFCVAVREGFEPSVPLRVRQFSKLVVSATHPPHQTFAFREGKGK